MPPPEEACEIATVEPFWNLLVLTLERLASVEAEGCPPLREAIARGHITGLASYSITANPEYRHLFPPGEEVSEGL